MEKSTKMAWVHFSRLSKSTARSRASQNQSSASKLKRSHSFGCSIQLHAKLIPRRRISAVPYRLPQPRTKEPRKLKLLGTPSSDWDFQSPSSG